MGEVTIHLRDGETAVVGYGSLLSVKSLEKTLQRVYEGPFIPCRVAGWRRSWDVAMPNQMFYYVDQGERIYPHQILYLNLRPVAGALVNSAVFVVRPEELTAMHRREWIYDSVVVTDQLRGAHVQGGEAIVYVARPEHVLRDATNPREAAVRASYLKVVDEGLRQRDPAFRAEYAATTDPVPAHLVVEDVLDPERQNPWAAARS
ncbi:MAG: hypothetical protein WD773_07900 [Gemmatimonadales bacterium]